MNACPHPGCDRPKDSDKFACKPHWFSLPKEIRDDIWRGFRYDRALWEVAAERAQQFWARRIATKQEEDRQGKLFG